MTDLVDIARSEGFRDPYETKFAETHGEERLAFLIRLAGSNDFAASLLRQIRNNRMMSEKQIAAIDRMIEADGKPAPVGGTVELTRIRKLFNDASQSGYKRPTYRADGVTLSLAPATGKNPGAIYVKASGAYAGKVIGNLFEPIRSCPPDVIEILRRVSADPLGEAVRYGQKTGRCACCGLELTNAVSVELGIGPICREKWGLLA